VRITIEADSVGVRLDKLVVDKVPGLGRAEAKRLFSEGKVRVIAAGSDRARRVAKGDVAVAGDVIEVEVEAGAGSTAATPDADAPLEIVLETKEIVVVDKRAGQPSAPLRPGELGTVANALAARYPEMIPIGFSPREPGLCHRLDTGTSGLLLAARTQRAFDVMTRALKDGRLDKRYLLVCSSADLPESGQIDHGLAPHPKDKRRVLACSHERDIARYAPRAASTTYRVIRVVDPWALVEASAPKAARHQIRAHFAAIDHPLAGDTLYGGDGAVIPRQALHAHRIAWHGGEGIDAFDIVSPAPADMTAILGE
jgi:23S rRNA pseudouridine1911/1915/1917 synthase